MPRVPAGSGLGVLGVGVQFRLLGEVEVRVDGSAVDVGHARQRCVLAALLVDANRLVPVSQIVDRVWSQRPPSAARNTVAGYVSRLRQVLALASDVSIARRADGYLMSVDLMAVDLHLFHHLSRRARAAGDAGEAGAALAIYERALALWRGEAFAGLDTRWLDDLRVGLDAERLAAELHRNDLALARGEHAALLGGLLARAAGHPLDERLTGQLMLALYRCGRQAEALHRYEQLRRGLAEELGADPSPPLQGIHRQILANDVPAPAAVPGVPPESGPQPPPVPHRLPAGASPVLERGHEIAELARIIKEAAAGAGCVVLIAGEAGIGKSSLLRLVSGLLPPDGRLLVGYCDDLATPRTLGPFRDLVGSVGADLADALDGRDRDRVFDAVRAELTATGCPTVLAVEDAHWADDATADVLCFLVRRVAALPVALVLTYRDGDLGVAQPLRRVLGQAARASRVSRLRLAPLSEAAVRHLTAGRLDPQEVYAVSGGNPFFVVEILAAAGAGRVPPTIADAVLTRTRSLDASTQDALERLAVVPSAVDRSLLDPLLPGGIASLAEAERRGLLDVSPDRVDFHHDLIRRAIVDSLPVARRVELHRRVLDTLLAREDTDLSRLMHHAVRAGAADAVVRYGPQAATESARAGSHREAAAHLRTVLGHGRRLGDGERADLLARYAIECYTIDAGPAALAAAREAVEAHRALGDPRALGATLRWLSRICWMAGEPDLMHRSADEAVAVLETAGDDRLLALALSNKSQVLMLSHRDEESIRIGERAITLARAIGDRAILAHALNNVGTARLRLGETRGRAMLEESLRVARAAGAIDDACRAYNNLTWSLLVQLDLADVGRYIAEAIELADDSEHFGYLANAHTHRAALGLATGAWEQGVKDAEFVLGAQPPAGLQVRCAALAVYGRIRIRQGQPDGDRLLSEAWELAERTREVQHLGPVAAARAEAAWLRDDLAAMAPLIEPTYGEARRLGSLVLAGELGYWLMKAGQRVPPLTSTHPYALQLAGRPLEAARAWRDAGCRYEYAAALAESADPDDLLAALAELGPLGAEPLARRVRRTLAST